MRCNMDYNKNNITLIFNENLDTCKNMFYKIDNIIEIDLSKFDASSVTSMNSMFSHCINLQKIKFGNIITSSVKDMSNLFSDCPSLLSIDLSNFDTSSVTTIKGMFFNCRKIKYIDASSFITSKVENMGDLFSDCIDLVFVNVSSFNTSKVTNMESMFRNCKKLKLIDLHNFSGESVETMSFMFYCCVSLIYLNLKNYHGTKSIIYFDYIFENVPNNLTYCSYDQNIISILFNKILDCFGSCFKENYKFNMETDVCVESCDNYEFKNLCYNECPEGTYKFMNKKCSDILPENYYLDYDNIYKECYQSCKKCIQSGTEANNKCDECKDGFITLYEPYINVPNCFPKCDYYYYFNDYNKYTCTQSCPPGYNILISAKNKCIDKCKNDDTYKYECNNDCVKECPFSTKIDVDNNKCLDSCGDKFEYNNQCYSDCPSDTKKAITEKRRECLIEFPENYYKDSDDIYKLCHKNCKTCYGAGTDKDNNCKECYPGYILINEVDRKYTCFQCGHYYYYDSSKNDYSCSSVCPSGYNILVSAKGKCIDQCKNDDTYKYECNNDCLKECPSSTKTDVDDYKCLQSCSDKFEYNNKCHSNCPSGTYKAITDKRECLMAIPVNYYLDINDGIHKKCHENCKKCYGAGTDKDNNCEECNSGYILINEADRKYTCLQCGYYYYYDSSKEDYSCTSSLDCPTNQKNLISEKKKCIDDCKNDNIYKYEYNNSCLEICPSYTKIDIDEKKCLQSCYDYKFEYNNNCYSNCPEKTYRAFQKRRICLDNLPENYYLDKSDNIHKKCHDNCKTCYGAGNDKNNNCEKCHSNYLFINETDQINTCFRCAHYYYFDNLRNEYSCTESSICQTNHNNFVSEKKKCIDECKNDDIYQFEYNNICLIECPNNTKIDYEEYKCLKLCYDYKFEYNNTCLSDCPNNTFRVFINRNICSDNLSENFYLDENDNIYKQCHENCKTCFGKGNTKNNNCKECYSNYIFINETNQINTCFECKFYYFFDNLTNNYLCTDSFICPTNHNNFVSKKKKCIDECKNDDTYKFDNYTNCLINCPNNIKTDYEEYKCLESCYDYKFEYNNTCLSDCPNNTYRVFINRNICSDNLTENFYLDENDNIYKKCHENCKLCYGKGNDENNNCKECISNFILINEDEQINTCFKCEYYYYFDNLKNNYSCTKSKLCPPNNSKLILEKKKCIDECKNDTIYKYEYNNICYSQCPDGLYEENKNNTCVTDKNCPREFPFLLKKECVINCSIIERQNKLCISKYINNTDKDFNYFDIITEQTSIELTNNFNNSVIDGIINEINFNITITKTNNQKGNIINFGQCEDQLRSIYKINKNESLYLLRFDIEQDGMRNPSFEYELYYLNNNTNLKKLNLSKCENIKVIISIPIKITGDIDKYNTSSPYYNDICYTTNSKYDISLSDRKNEYINNNMSLCDINCEFVSYNFETQKAVCSCGIKTEIPFMKNLNFDKNVLLNSFTDIDNFANTKMMTCYKIVFKTKNLIKNIGCYIFTILILLNLIFLFSFYYKYFNQLINIIKKFKSKILNRNGNTNNKINNNINTTKIDKKKTHTDKNFKNISKIKHKKVINKKNNYKEPIGDKLIGAIKDNYKEIDEIILGLKLKISKRKSNIIKSKDTAISLKQNSNHILNNKSKKSNKSNKNVELNNSELNDLKYKEAIIKDKRACTQYYISLIKINHIILFICNSNDFNSKIIKSSIFIFNIASLIAINALFFTDSTMHKIYIDQGSYNIIYQLPQTVYSAISSGIVMIIIKYLGFSEKNILGLKEGNIKNINKRERELINILKIKFCLFYIINFILLFLFWYYVTCFCGIYKNTQIHLFKDSLVSLGTSLITPFIIYFFPAILRIYGLKHKCKCIYSFSKILQIL